MKISLSLIIALLSILGSLGCSAESEVAKTDPVYTAKELDREPVPLVRIAPVYPEKEKKNRVQATVHTEIIIDSAGNVHSPKVLKFTLQRPKRLETKEAYEATRKAFTDSVTTTVVKWKYEPGLKDGKAVDSRVELPLAYTLRR